MAGLAVSPGMGLTEAAADQNHMREEMSKTWESLVK